MVISNEDLLDHKDSLVDVQNRANFSRHLTSSDDYYIPRVSRLQQTSREANHSDLDGFQQKFGAYYWQ
jgi:hypothetical protein